MVSPATPYIGRFAPSPTGPLHFGSLATAVASYLDARHYHGQWLLRMEDIDPPREMAGAADLILKQLENHALHWDSKVLFQSTRSDAYRETLKQLEADGLIYRCHCSRQQLKERGGLHPRRCTYTGNPDRPHALRLAVADQSEITYTDLFQGQQHQHIKQEVGDFVLHRKDGLFAYQLAVVLDDAFQGVNHVIRGSDLLDSTARQIYLQKLLGVASPQYGHLPVAVDAAGNKLSKQNMAASVERTTPTLNLWVAMQWLGMTPPQALQQVTPGELITWAIPLWDRKAVPGLIQQLAP